DLVRQGIVDALWHDRFRERVRAAIIGEAYPGETFEQTIEGMLDPRADGYDRADQVVNYVTSHDVEGLRRERLYNYLNNCGVIDTKPRIEMAFACLLTAVGIPMILAGEEFADQHDLATVDPDK